MEINREMLVQSFREETEECLVQMEQLLLGTRDAPGRSRNGFFPLPSGAHH